jgi:Tol biopolymer transport system component
MSLGLTVILMLICIEQTKADFTFGEPMNLGPMVNSPVEDGGVAVSPDGLELYVSSFLDGFGVGTFRRATRESTDDPWGEAVGLEHPFKRIVASCISADGLSLYFDSERSGGSGGADLWMATRASISDPWINPLNLGPAVNSPTFDLGPSVSGDGLELYFGSIRPGGSGDWDIWVSTRASTSDAWGQAVNLGPTVNSSVTDGQPFITPDGLALLITSNRPGGYGDWDIWITKRTSRGDDWGTPVNLGPSLNTAAGESEPYISADGQTLYFSDWWVPRAGGIGKNDIWQVPIIPIVDFTGDYRVDIEDLIILIENWGKDDPALDMGPMPWGDGVIDAADLEVLMSHWGRELDDPNLLGHWQLDEVEGHIATDRMKNYDATVIGEPVWQPMAGIINGAIELDGIDDHLATDFVIDPSKGPMSVFAWVRGGAPGQAIIAQGMPNPMFGSTWLGTHPDDGRLITAHMFPIIPALESDVVITDGQWHRVGLIWDGTLRHLYVDDVEVASDLEKASHMTSSLGLHIGADSHLTEGSFWSGLIDDLRVYNRVVTPQIGI